jgi:hypothetical protein
MKKNESIWHRLTAGLDAQTKKRKFWYEFLPGVCAFKAISLGRIRKMWLVGKQHLVLYRNFEDKCTISWISESQLIERP